MADKREVPRRDVRLMWQPHSVGVSFLAIILYLLLHYAFHVKSRVSTLPLWFAVIVGGLPLLYDLSRQVLNRQFGSDFLAGLSIITATLMGELARRDHHCPDAFGRAGIGGIRDTTCILGLECASQAYAQPGPSRRRWDSARHCCDGHWCRRPSYHFPCMKYAQWMGRLSPGQELWMNRS